jgi:hypothetical protein
MGKFEFKCILQELISYLIAQADILEIIYAN